MSGHAGDVTSVAFSPDGKAIASGSLDHTIRFWEATSGKEVAVLRGHGGEVTSVAFSANGRRLASAGWDRVVKVWDMQTGQMLASMAGHGGVVTAVAFSPDSKRLASSSLDRGLKIWDPETGTEVATLKVQSSNDARVCRPVQPARDAAAQGTEPGRDDHQRTAGVADPSIVAPAAANSTSGGTPRGSTSVATPAESNRASRLGHRFKAGRHASFGAACAPLRRPAVPTCAISRVSVPNHRHPTTVDEDSFVDTWSSPPPMRLLEDILGPSVGPRPFGLPVATTPAFESGSHGSAGSTRPCRAVQIGYLSNGLRIQLLPSRRRLLRPHQRAFASAT